MKFLTLDIVTRGKLTELGALEVDSNGDEILVGLTHEESQLYIRLQASIQSGLAPSDVTEVERFVMLSNRYFYTLSKPITVRRLAIRRYPPKLKFR